MPSSELSVELLKQWKKMRRDLLYMRYGDDWRKHDDRKDFFSTVPTEDEKLELEVLMGLACNEHK